jgi:outer membrane lipoprotein-sorting protein
VTSDTLREITSGSIYYQKPGGIVIKVKDPIDQWMVLEGDTMLIYYPTDSTAFRFHSDNPFSLPFFQLFVGMGNTDLGLSKAGFTLDRNEVRHDTLITYWKPPEQAGKSLGNAIVVLVENKLVFMELQNAKGKTLTNIAFNDHLQYRGTYFPLEITSVEFEDSDSTVETVVFHNPQFNVELPPEVINFKIPQGIEVEEIEW